MPEYVSVLGKGWISKAAFELQKKEEAEEAARVKKTEEDRISKEIEEKVEKAINKATRKPKTNSKAKARK